MRAVVGHDGTATTAIVLNANHPLRSLFVFDCGPPAALGTQLLADALASRPLSPKGGNFGPSAALGIYSQTPCYGAVVSPRKVWSAQRV